MPIQTLNNGDTNLNFRTKLNDNFSLLELTKQNALGFTPEDPRNKGQPNGYAPLGGDSKISSAYLPSYVDDVVEVTDYASLPVTGEIGKIYIVLTGAEANREYRWSGTVYVEIKDSGETVGSMGALINGATAKATPVDADKVSIWDSVSGLMQAVTWANIKATLKTYFDTLYNLYVLPTASTTVLGGVKVDGTTITIASGVISSSGGGGAGLTAYDGIVAGELTTGTIFEIGFASAKTLSKFKCSLKTLPTGADFIIKAYKNGVEDASVTIATTATATNGLYVSDDTTFVSGSFAENDRLTITITQVGSTLSGTGLAWQII